MKAKAFILLCVGTFLFTLVSCEKEDNGQTQQQPLVCTHPVFTTSAILTDSIQLAIEDITYTRATYGNGMFATHTDTTYSMALACSWQVTSTSKLRLGQFWFKKMFNVPEINTADRYQMLLPGNGYIYAPNSGYGGIAMRMQYNKTGVADDEWRTDDGDNTGNVFTIEERSPIFVVGIDSFCRVSGRFCCRFYNADNSFLPVSGNYSTPVKLTYH
ncbi:MAG TPA: hypothetical protein VK154_05780 [Chitinophagales bacterium]|nr:hypothetical protein [Chitinophagales bacterium]